MFGWLLANRPRAGNCVCINSKPTTTISSKQTNYYYLQRQHQLQQNVGVILSSSTTTTTTTSLFMGGKVRRGRLSSEVDIDTAPHLPFTMRNANPTFPLPKGYGITAYSGNVCPARMRLPNGLNLGCEPHV